MNGTHPKTITTGRFSRNVLLLALLIFVLPKAYPSEKGAFNQSWQEIIDTRLTPLLNDWRVFENQKNTKELGVYEKLKSQIQEATTLRDQKTVLDHLDLSDLQKSKLSDQNYLKECGKHFKDQKEGGFVFIANDRQKSKIIEFADVIRPFFSTDQRILGTGTTGQLIGEWLGQDVERKGSGPNGDIDFITEILFTLKAEGKTDEWTHVVRLLEKKHDRLVRKLNHQKTVYNQFRLDKDKKSRIAKDTLTRDQLTRLLDEVRSNSSPTVPLEKYGFVLFFNQKKEPTEPHNEAIQLLDDVFELIYRDRYATEQLTAAQNMIEMCDGWLGQAHPTQLLSGHALQIPVPAQAANKDLE